MDRGLHDCVGQGREGGLSGGDVGQAEHIGRGDAQPFGPHQLTEAEPPLIGSLAPGQRLAGQRRHLGGGSGGKSPIVAQVGEELGMSGQTTGEQRAGAEKQAQAPGRLGRLAEKGDEVVPSMLAGGQAAQSEESGVGVGSLGEPAEQERQQLLHQAGGSGEAPRQLQDGLAGAVGVAEPEGGQPLTASPGRPGRPVPGPAQPDRSDRGER